MRSDLGSKTGAAVGTDGEVAGVSVEFTISPTPSSSPPRAGGEIGVGAGSAGGGGDSG